MPSVYNYDWEAAQQAFKASGLPLLKFHRLHAANFARSDWVPSYDTMGKRLRGWGSDKDIKHRQVGVNLSIVELPTASASVMERSACEPTMSRQIGVGSGRGSVHIELPSGVRMSFDTNQPEAFALQVLTAGGVL